MQRAGNTGRGGDLEEGQMEMEHYFPIPIHDEKEQTEQPKSPPTTESISRSRNRKNQPCPPLSGGCPPTSRHPRSFGFGRRFSSPDNWVHLIPLLVVLSIFFLWWFSNPAKLVIKDGRMALIHSERPLFINETDMVYDLGRLAILAVSASPIPTLELTLTIKDKTAGANPASSDN